MVILHRYEPAANAQRSSGVAALEIREEDHVVSPVRVLTLKIGAGDDGDGGDGVIMHAVDAERLSGFVDGAELWIKPFGEQLRVREPARIDRGQAIAGPGVLLAPPHLLHNL